MPTKKNCSWYKFLCHFVDSLVRCSENRRFSVACILSKNVTIRCAVLLLKYDTWNILRYVATLSPPRNVHMARLLKTNFGSCIGLKTHGLRVLVRSKGEQNWRETQDGQDKMNSLKSFLCSVPSYSAALSLQTARESCGREGRYCTNCLSVLYRSSLF
jgi:hypothetical protein